MDIIEAVLQLPDQCFQALAEASEIKLPDKYYKAKNIVVCSMGGSSLGAHVYKKVFWQTAPLEIVNGYKLPDYAKQETLVILSSYSGNTEEVISCAAQAKERGCMIAGITSGGKLKEWLLQGSYPNYIFDPKYNATGQPRMGIGYTIFGLFGMLVASFEEYEGVMDDSEHSLVLLDNEKDVINKEAKAFALNLKNKQIVIFGAEKFTANAHIFANQLNETAKTFSSWYEIPEANHHLLEGLKHPDIKGVAVFLGGGYPERIARRFEITKDILKKNNWKVCEYVPTTASPTSCVLETLLFSSLVSVYLGLEYGEDTISIPTVDYFKEKLG